MTHQCYICVKMHLICRLATRLPLFLSDQHYTCNWIVLHNTWASACRFETNYLHFYLKFGHHNIIKVYRLRMKRSGLCVYVNDAWRLNVTDRVLTPSCCRCLHSQWRKLDFSVSMYRYKCSMKAAFPYLWHTTDI